LPKPKKPTRPRRLAIVLAVWVLLAIPCGGQGVPTIAPATVTLTPGQVVGVQVSHPVRAQHWSATGGTLQVTGATSATYRAGDVLGVFGVTAKVPPAEVCVAVRIVASDTARTLGGQPPTDVDLIGAEP
jgi:hypothetical protein